MTSLNLSGARYVLTATVVFLHGFFTLDIRQNRCVAVFHHELVTFSLVFRYISLFSNMNFFFHSGHEGLLSFKQMTDPTPC